MAEVRKHGQGGGSFAAAIEKAMAEGVRPSAAGAPPGPGRTGTDHTGGDPRESTQHLITASSFLTSDPFLPKAQPAPTKPFDPADEVDED